MTTHLKTLTNQSWDDTIMEDKEENDDEDDEGEGTKDDAGLEEK